MSELLYELKGINGQLFLYEDKIVIKREGVLSKMTQGFLKEIRRYTLIKLQQYK